MRDYKIPSPYLLRYLPQYSADRVLALKALGSSGHPALSCLAALKYVHPSLLGDPDFLQNVLHVHNAGKNLGKRFTPALVQTWPLTTARTFIPPLITDELLPGLFQSRPDWLSDAEFLTNLIEAGKSDRASNELGARGKSKMAEERFFDALWGVPGIVVALARAGVTTIRAVEKRWPHALVRVRQALEGQVTDAVRRELGWVQ